MLKIELAGLCGRWAMTGVVWAAVGAISLWAAACRGQQDTKQDDTAAKTESTAEKSKGTAEETKPAAESPAPSPSPSDKKDGMIDARRDSAFRREFALFDRLPDAGDDRGKTALGQIVPLVQGARVRRGEMAHREARDEGQVRLDPVLGHLVRALPAFDPAAERVSQEVRQGTGRRRRLRGGRRRRPENGEAEDRVLRGRRHAETHERRIGRLRHSARDHRRARRICDLGRLSAAGALRAERSSDREDSRSRPEAPRRAEIRAPKPQSRPRQVRRHRHYHVTAQVRRRLGR